MFTVVYVIADSEKLFFYNEMMKSLTSIRMHMPEQKVCVLTDDRTYDILKRVNAEVFELADVMCVPVSDDYSQVERSRLLKVTVRQRLSGDLLYIDTDTVICDALPEIKTDKSIGMVLELHSYRNEINWYLTDRYDQQSGLDLGNYKYFFNSGVVWSKDDEHAHRIYEKWHALWEQTRKNGTPRDQSPLNYTVREEIEHIEILNGIWNCQLARAFSMGLNYLADAHIIHYFNVKTSAYMFGQDEYRDLPYNDERIIEMLKHPKSLFSRCRLVKLDNENHIDGCNLEEIWPLAQTPQYRLMQWFLRHGRVTHIVETGIKLMATGKRILFAPIRVLKRAMKAEIVGKTH